MTPKAIEMGILHEEQVHAFNKKNEAKKNSFKFLNKYFLSSPKWFERGITQASETKNENFTAKKMLSLPNIKLADIQAAW